MSESQLNSRDITFRTVFHDVEGIKSYLRRIRKENERVMTNIQSIVFEQVQKAFSSTVELNKMIISTVDNRIEELVSPLRTEWVNDAFADHIAENISDTTINVISSAFMSIVNDNSTNFNAYINRALTTDRIEAFISPLKTEWVNDAFADHIAENISDTTISVISNAFMSIVNDNSTNFNAYINSAIDSDNTISVISSAFMSIVNDNSTNFNAYINSALTTDRIEAFISPLKTAWVNDAFADHIGEINLKSILETYHLIEKHYTTLTEQVTINISDPTMLKKFRILAYISGDKATDNLHYTYTPTAIFEDAYTITGGEITPSLLTIANITTNTNSFTVNFNTANNNVDYKNYLSGTLWYGFTDLIDPITSI